MKRTAALLLGVLLAVVSGSYAATGGGFPSRPNFQAVGVNASAPATAGSVRASTGYGVNANPATATPFTANCGGASCQMSLTDGTATQTFGVVSGVLTSSGNVVPGTDATRTLGASGARWLTVFGSTLSDGATATGATVSTTGSTTQFSSGSSWTAVQFGNASSNPSYSFLGTGTVTIGGNATVGGQSVCRADGTNCPTGATTGFAIACTTACNVSTLAVGQSALIRATTARSQTSNTTQAADTDLQFTNVPTGTYSLHGNTIWTGSGGGLKLDVAYSGTITASDSLWTAHPGGASAGSCTGGVTLIRNSVSTSPSGFYTCTTWGGSTTNIGFPDGDSSVVTTSSATLSLSWAQNSSNATPSTRNAGSWLVLKRIT